jgi:hypothetical protein
MTSATLYEIVKISSPYGKTIECTKRGNVLISITKITMFGLGRIQFPEQAELAQLRQERHANQRKFSKNQENIRRLERLERLEYNYRRSLGNLKVIQDVGLNDSDEVVRQLIDHLLTVGQSVSADGYHTSEIDAPLGKLYIQSYWQILSDERNYLATVIFMSKV